VLTFAEQRINDGVIEVMSYASSWALGVERLKPGHARRIGQYNKPVVLEFREKDDGGHDIVTYTQIDGEFYKVKRPKSMKIQLSTEIPNGKIRVMVKH